MSLRQRVLIVGINYAPETTGIAPYTTGMAEALSEQYDITVLTTPPHYPQWNVAPEWRKWSHSTNEGGINVKRLRHYVPRSPTGPARIVSEKTFAARLLLERPKGFDAVIAVTPALLSVYAAALIAKTNKAPLGVVVQDIYALAMSEVGLLGGKAATATARLEGKALRMANQVSVIHDRFAERLSQDFGVESDKLSVIRNWSHIEPPAGDIAATRAALGWGDNETIVLHAGNMGAKQDLENVVAAARLANSHEKPVRFVLMGNGSRRSALEQVAQGVGSITFQEPVGNDQFSDVLAAADVLLLNELPGVAEMCVPSKLTSYFAAARPVVAATNAGSAAAFEVDAADAGIVIAPGDPAAMVNAVVDLTRRDTTAIGTNGRAFAQRVLSKDAAYNAYRSWTERLLHSKN
jgi:colanic acid biosynthesis glycosyl transferase WcaI